MSEAWRRDRLWALPALLALLLGCWGLGEGGATGLSLYYMLGAATILLLATMEQHRPPRVNERAVLVLSVVFVVLAAVSLWPSPNRGITVGAIATLVAGVAVMHASGRISHPTATKLVAAQSLIVLPIAASAVLEPLGMGWLPAHDYFPGRAMANMGGPGPLGALLAAVIPVAVAFFLTSSRRIPSILWGAAVAFMIASLTATFSRAALVATVVGSLAAAAVLVRVHRLAASGESRGRRRVLLRVLLVGTMALLTIPAYNAIARRQSPADFAIGTRPGTQTFELTRRIEGTELTNTEVRVLCWETALGTIARTPLTGVGAGCFGAASESALPDGLKRVAAARGLVYGYAYNDYLQVGAELGIPALAVFVALLAVILLSAGSACRGHAQSLLREPHRLAAIAGAAGGLSALLAQGLVDFPLHLPSHQALLWVNLGLLTALVNPGAAHATDRVAARTPLKWLTLAVAVLLAAAMATVATRGALAERFAHEAMRLRASGDLEEALARARRSTALAPHEHTYWVLLGETANELALGGIDTGRAMPMVFDAYRQAARTYPGHAPTYGRAGALYLEHVDAVPGAVDSAEVCLRRAIDLNPYYADPHTNLGTVLMMTGNHGAARTEFLLAARLDTIAAAPLFNLGNLELSTGRKSEAEARYRAALTREPTHMGALVNLSVLMVSDGRRAEALKLLRAALLIDPGMEHVRTLLSTLE